MATSNYINVEKYPLEKLTLKYALLSPFSGFLNFLSNSSGKQDNVSVATFI